MRIKTKKKVIAVTIGFIVLISIAALLVLYWFGALDDKATSMKYNAESVCFISGYYDGVINFTEVNGVYSFECDRSGRTKVEFNGHGGVIKYG